MDHNALKLLSQFISDLSLDEVSEEVLKAAKIATLDSIGSALGALSYEEVPSIIELFSEYSGTANQNASVWGSGKKVSPFKAAFLNGILAHSLELDDVHTKSKTHIGAVVLPAAWALGEVLGLSGKRFLEAVIVGYEAMARIGEGFGVSDHRLKGWHVTGTAGTFGAAAASAKLLNLDALKTGFALGMAGTQSSGLWAFLESGSTSKKLHAGRAAENGVVAAFLAKAGMTGPMNILDAKDGGLYRATSESYDIAAVSRNLGTEFEILNVDRKPYACCRSMHPAIDAVLHIGKQQSIPPLSVKKITVRTYDVAVKQCGVILYPENVSESKFSMPFAVACSLVDGMAGKDQFSEKKISSEQLRNLATKVQVVEDEAFTVRYPKEWGCSVTLETNDGKIFEKTVTDASGSVANPLSDDQVFEKFSSLTREWFGEERCQNLIKTIMNLENEQFLPLL